MSINPVFSTVVSDPVHFWVFGLVVNYYNSFGKYPTELDILEWYSGLHGFGSNYQAIASVLFELAENGHLQRERKFNSVSPSTYETVYSPNPNFLA